MIPSLQNKRILITGASAGLGRALVDCCLARGASVIAMASRPERLDALHAKYPAIDIRCCDVSDKTAVQTCVRAIWADAPVDIVILNAGVKPTADALFSLETIEQNFAVNFFGVTNILDVAIPCMTQQGRGHLVCISSLGQYHGMVRAHGYNASKAALSNMMESLRMDLMTRRLPIDITVVYPGLLRTGMMKAPGRIGRCLSVEVTDAAKRIVAGIAQRKARIIFPRTMYWFTKMMASLPVAMQSAIFSRLKT